MHTDPVCGMTVSQDSYSSVANGRLYHFCSEGCLQRFEASQGKYIQNSEYDLIIIGGGPAGLTAAVYAALQNLDTFLITKDIGGQAIDSTKVKNYMGFDFITGPDLTAKFQDQLLRSNYVDHHIGEVISIAQFGEKFIIRTLENEEYMALSVILATGMQRRRLGIPGEDRLQRKGLFYTRVQDTGILKGKTVAVIGGGNTGVQVALNLKSVAAKITLVTFEDLTADTHLIKKLELSDIRVYRHHAVKSIGGAERVSQLIIAPRSGGSDISLAVEAVFIGVGFSPNSALVSGLLDRNFREEIIIQNDCRTSIPGIFAAGDVTDIIDKRIIIASGEGAKASLAAYRYLKEWKKAH